MVTDMLVSGSTIDLDESELEDSPQTFASYPDLYVISISAVTNPLEGLKTSKFHMRVGNKRGASASNVKLGIKVDNELIGIAKLGTISVNSEFIGSVEFLGIPAGSHTVEMIADINNSITESNESNNSLKKMFTWKGAPDQTFKLL